LLVARAGRIRGDRNRKATLIPSAAFFYFKSGVLPVQGTAAIASTGPVGATPTASTTLQEEELKMQYPLPFLERDDKPLLTAVVSELSDNIDALEAIDGERGLGKHVAHVLGSLRFLRDTLETRIKRSGNFAPPPAPHLTREYQKDEI
jgi:hypothetical protein